MKQEDTVIIDARNDYEFDLGHFKGAIKPDIESFRELPIGFVKIKKYLKVKRF